MYLLGIDLGTSAVKSLLVSTTGEILYSVSESYPLAMPRDGWSEQDPADWWAAVKRSIRAIGEHYDTRKIEAISFSGQMHGLVILDDRDEVIRPCILWNDTRTNEEVHYLNDVIGKQKIIEETGNIAYAGFTAPKILWLKKHEPDHFARIAKIMLPKDYLAYRFSGVHSTDYSDASGMLLLDVRKKIWSKFMIDLCEIREDQLAKLYESFDAVGKVLPEVARELNLSEDCLIVAGAGDNAAAAVGTGTFGEHACNISLGTSGTIFITNKEFVPIPNSELHSFCHADGAYHVMGVLLSAASANQWWVKHILQAEDYDSVYDTPELGSNRVFFMPYLMGERSPHNDEKIRGAFVGLSMTTSKSQMSQAVLEGVSFAMRDCLEVVRAQGIQITRTKIAGGGAKSTLWKQILANVLNLEIQELLTDEGPSLGAAILAGVGSAGFNNLEEGARLFLREGNVIAPDQDIVAKYDTAYAKYRRLYPMLKDFYA